MKLFPIWARLCLLISVLSCLPAFARAAGPTITAQPQPGYVNQGSSITLSVTATASSTLTYQWEQNGYAVPGANGASLTISNAVQNEGGTYDVIVTADSISVKSAQVTVTVVIPPTISTPFTTAVTAVNGQYFQISPGVNGTYPITYSWTKDGTVDPLQTNGYYSATTTSASAGTYVLTATNSAGSATSASYVVTVVDAISITMPSDVTANAGDTVTLSPTVTGPGTLSYSWYGPHGFSANTRTVTLPKVSVLDAGYYQLYVSNAYQYNSYGTVDVTVNGPPIINTQPSDVTIGAGNYYSIYTQVSGTGIVTFTWTKDGQPLTSTTSGGAAGIYLIFSSAALADSGTYSFTASNAYGSVTSNSFKVTVLGNIYAPTITSQPVSTSISSGATASFSVTATSSYGAMTYQWYKDGNLIPGATSSTLNIVNATAADVGLYSVGVANSNASTLSTAAALSVTTSGIAPTITAQPSSQTVNLGDTITLSAGASGTPAPAFQWQKNGSNIAGANGTNLIIAGAQLTDAGSYTVVASNTVGSATSSAATVTVQDLPQTRVTNLSTRAQVGTGANVLIAGFIINGSTPKKMLIRALGPTLANYSVKNPLADPTLKIVDGAGNTVVTNDDWQTTSNIDDFNAASTKSNAIPLPDGSKDAALVTTLNPGGYTALVSGKSGATGIALVELYEVDTNTSNQLVNISSRANVGTGDAVTIAGIIVSGSVPKKFLVRAIGPGLQARSVPGFLADPNFQIVDGSNNVVATNDNWETSDTLSDTKSVTSQVNAVPLDAGSKDAALTVTLAPGGYTVVVRGTGGTTGIALVELYQVL